MVGVAAGKSSKSWCRRFIWHRRSKPLIFNEVRMSMQPERQKQAAPQTMARADRPVPQPAGPFADRTPATRISKRAGSVLAALAVGCLAIAAVATGLVNIPGVNSNPSSPPVASLSATDADQGPLASDERSRIGVNMIDLSQNLAKSMQLKTDRLDGVVITKAWPNTPAERAGLFSGDIILAVDGIPVASAAQFRCCGPPRKRWGSASSSATPTIKHWG
jgi:hypothetical protein